MSGYQSLADTGFGGDPAGDHSGRCDNGWPRHLGRDSAGEWGLGAALQVPSFAHTRKNTDRVFIWTACMLN